MFQPSSNCFRKIGDQWCIQVVGDATTGDLVEVRLASGATKKARLGELVATLTTGKVYANAHEKKEPKAAADVGSLARILELFDTAKRHLKHPAITLGLNAFQGDTRGLRISIAGSRAKVPGSLTLTSSRNEKGSDGRRFWYGRVLTNGTYQPTDDAPESVAHLLSKFAADPVTTAQEHGLLTGNCCFCDRPLGYGKVCADHYGLPWGARPVAFAEPANEHQHSHAA